MFHLHRSNRTEELVEALSRLVAKPLGGPTVPECIVVQGKGMERWLSMQLARRLGVWANPSFPFPRKLIERAMAAVLGEPEADAAAWEPESLLWAVARALPELLERPEFAPLRTYLADDERGRKRFQLARRIAATFDHYAVYRPDLALGWERAGGDADWQVVLWRRLRDAHGSHHFAARADRFLAELGRGAALAPAFPARVSLFGLSTLPPLYVRLLAAIAARVDVHLFLLSPSREYWADVRSRRDLLRRRLRADGHLPTEAELAEIEGNALLASLGRLGREFQEVLEAEIDYVEDEPDLYRDPGGDGGTMLEVLQGDVLHLANRGPGALAPLPVRAGDDSIEVHSCHGPMREIEALHDRLLALFEADPGLRPHDVIVMAPSIDAYTPYIEAVFRPGGGDRSRIPFRIADRRARFTEEVSDAFFRLLDVLGGRLGASEIVDLLGLEAVAARFGLGPEDLELARRWIAEAGVRWGADAAHRAECGQPAVGEHTWRFGLDRLLLGYALPGDERSLAYGVLPCDQVEGTEGAVLGRLAELCETLFRHRLRLQAERTPAEWRDDLGALLAETIASNNRTAHQHQALRSALGALARRAAAAGFGAAIDLEAIRPLLEDEIQEGSSARGFLSGGVTFCELVPMRTIPFRVVCLIGMSHGAFPRLRRPLGFDEVARHPRRGDRTPREDDRYLFLEALLSARDRLLVTFAGQSIRDNTPAPPSVVVSELLDTVGRSFTGAAVLVRHPLQPFSPRNFDGGTDARLQSYSARHFAGATALAAARAAAAAPETPRASFVGAPLALADEPPRRLTVDQLARFFERPSRGFLQQRLGLYLGSDLPPLEDREPLLLDNLQLWKVGDRLLRIAAEGEEARRLFDVVRAAALLPPGEIGRAIFAGAADEAASILDASSARRQGERRPPLEVDLAIGDTRLVGAIGPLWPSGLVRTQFSRLGKRHELGLWIHHLALAVCDPGASTWFFGRPPARAAGAIQFKPVEGAAGLLARLVELYWLGQRWPLPLFEGASRAFAVTVQDGEGEGEAWAAAKKAFDAGEYSRGADADDESVAQIYGPVPTLDAVVEHQRRHAEIPAFDALALEVLKPLLEHREEIA